MAWPMLRARNQPCYTALTKLYIINFTPMATATSTPGSTGNVVGTDMLIPEFSMEKMVADNIGRMILARYDALMGDHGGDQCEHRDQMCH